MKIRRTKDYETIAKLNEPVHNLHAKLYPRYFKQYNFVEIKETFKRVINNDRFIFLILNNDQEDVGYVWIEDKTYPENAFRKGYRSIYVHQICVEASKREKGYGTKLMEEIYSIAQEKEMVLVELDYWIGNGAMNHFCNKHQFTKYREFVYKRL